MKLLRYYSSYCSADGIAKKLESKGILTHVTGKYSQKLSSLYTGAFKVGLWVVIDNQYEDAFNYLNNRKHKITTGINKKEINRLKKTSKPNIQEAMNNLVAYGCIFAVILLFIFFQIIR